MISDIIVGHICTPNGRISSVVGEHGVDDEHDAVDDGQPGFDQAGVGVRGARRAGEVAIRYEPRPNVEHGAGDGEEHVHRGTDGRAGEQPVHHGRQDDHVTDERAGSDHGAGYGLHWKALVVQHEDEHGQSEFYAFDRFVRHHSAGTRGRLLYPFEYVTGRNDI